MAQFSLELVLDRHEALSASSHHQAPRSVVGWGSSTLVLQVGKKAEVHITMAYSEREVVEHIEREIGRAYDGHVESAPAEAEPAITDEMVEAACVAYHRGPPMCEEDGPLVADMLAEAKADMFCAIAAALRVAAEARKQEAA